MPAAKLARRGAIRFNALVRPPVLPDPPKWVPWVAGAVWAVLLVGAALIGDSKSFGAEFAKGLLGTAATVAFAVAGIGAVLQNWQRREWRRRSQYVAFEAYRQTLGETRLLAEDLLRIFESPAETATPRGTTPSDVFQLPFGNAQLRAWFEVTGGVLPVCITLNQASMDARHRWNRLWNEELADRDSTFAARLRDEDEVFAELRNNHPELEPLLPSEQQAEPEDVASEPPPTNLIHAVIALSEEVAADVAARGERIRDLTDEAASYAGAHAHDLLLEGVRLRDRTRAVAEAVMTPPAQPLGRGEETLRAHSESETTERASSIANRAQIALMTCYTVVHALSAAYTDLRAFTDPELEPALKAERMHGDLLKLLTDLSITERMRGAAIVRQVDQVREQMDRRREARREGDTGAGPPEPRVVRTEPEPEEGSGPG